MSKLDGWGYYMNTPLNMQEVDELGAELSTVLHCPIHYPAFGKHLFECRCGVIFPVYIVRGKDWPAIVRRHEEERSLVEA